MLAKDKHSSFLLKCLCLGPMFLLILPVVLVTKKKYKVSMY
jgi:hypothetical protein